MSVNCRFCTLELIKICEIIGWTGTVADVTFCLVFSYLFHKQTGSVAASLSFIIVTVCHFIGSICLLIAIRVPNKLFFLPWVISNLAAMVLLLISAFIWDMINSLIMLSLLLWIQAYVWKYIAERFTEDRGKNLLNI